MPLKPQEIMTHGHGCAGRNPVLPFHSGPHTQLRESNTQVLTKSHEQGGQHTDWGSSGACAQHDGHPAEAGWVCWGRAQGGWWGVDSYVNKQTPRLGQEPLVLRDRKAFPPGAIWTRGQAAPTAPSSVEPAPLGPAAMSPGAAQRQRQKIKGQSVRAACTWICEVTSRRKPGPVRRLWDSRRGQVRACELQLPYS